VTKVFWFFFSKKNIPSHRAIVAARAMDRPPMPLEPRFAARGRSLAEARYRALRDVAFRAAEVDLAAAGISADLRAIDAAAIAAAGQWTGRRVAWPWHVMAPDWRRNHPARFEVAVWQGDVLCGLALGRPAPTAAHLSLHYIERNPDPESPLRGKVTRTVIDALGAYGVVLGKTEMRLVDPLPALVPFYCSPAFGFRLVTPAGEVPYCRRSI
jgi:hypothetical protein